MEKRNLTLLTDLYQLTMMNGYLKEDMQDQVVIFDVFFRQKATPHSCQYPYLRAFPLKNHMSFAVALFFSFAFFSVYHTLYGNHKIF